LWALPGVRRMRSHRDRRSQRIWCRRMRCSMEPSDTSFRWTQSSNQRCRTRKSTANRTGLAAELAAPRRRVRRDRSGASPCGQRQQPHAGADDCMDVLCAANWHKRVKSVGSVPGVGVLTERLIRRTLAERNAGSRKRVCRPGRRRPRRPASVSRPRAAR